MVKFNINENDLVKHYKEIYLYRNKYSLILSLVLIIVWIILGIFGLCTKNNNTIFLALGFIFLELLLILFSYISLRRTTNMAVDSFNKLYPSGERICEVSLLNDTISINEIVLDTKTNILKSDIKKTIVLKSIVIFKLVDKNYIYLPKSEDLINELNIENN